MADIILPKLELCAEFQDFINENGLWFEWKSFIEGKGYRLEEFGMSHETED